MVVKWNWNSKQKQTFMPTFFNLSFELGEENERQENASKHVYMVSSLSEILYQKNISYPDFSTQGKKLK